MFYIRFSTVNLSGKSRNRLIWVQPVCGSAAACRRWNKQNKTHSCGKAAGLSFDPLSSFALSWHLISHWRRTDTFIGLFSKGAATWYFLGKLPVAANISVFKARAEQRGELLICVVLLRVNKANSAWHKCCWKLQLFKHFLFSLRMILTCLTSSCCYRNIKNTKKKLKIQLWIGIWYIMHYANRWSVNVQSMFV